MISFKKFIAEKKLPHALDPNKSLKHAFTDRMFDKDTDGDTDKFDKNTPDEITGDEKPNQTPKMLKKYAGEKQHTKKGNAYEEVEVNEGSETWEAGYKRRVVKTTDPDHKEKGHNWRIKGKDKPNLSIKLYKEKPSYKEFTKQMKRVAGHEFGG